MLQELLIIGGCLLSRVIAIAYPQLQVSARLDGDHLQNQTRPAFFLGGPPEDWKAHPYDSDVQIAPHTASGAGLFAAETGREASFTIQVAEEQGTDSDVEWNVDKHRFIYVWIASADHVFIAEVQKNDKRTLTATYESAFPGTYLVYVEDVDLRAEDETNKGRPIVGSPFPLVISGQPKVDVDSLPVCGTQTEDTSSTFWRPGSWVSSKIASAEHGVLRDGWVFQPKTCVHDTFSYDDLMHLARLKEEAWLLAVGNSILRGVFLSLVDMVLAQGQKDNLSTSILRKCWGFADVRIGSLRLTYQDLRLYTIDSVDDMTVCHDEKLESGSTAAYVTSSRIFFERTVFQDNASWPSVIWAPSNMIDSDDAPNLQIQVLMDALPQKWNGSLIMMEHMYAFGYGWNTANPTPPTLDGVNPVNQNSPPSKDHGLARMAQLQQRDSRLTFMSVFPIYQARLFENERTRAGKRCYGCSIHYHYISDPLSPESYGGSKMVHSTVTELIANIIISKAVGTKSALLEKVAYAPESEKRSEHVGEVFEVCTDCPASLLPYHVKTVPALQCETAPLLRGNASVGTVWDAQLCPDWCLATDSVGHVATGSGLVVVRACRSEAIPP